jgi:hypothetical protein
VGGYHCRAAQGDDAWEGEGASAEEAYARALLAILRSREAPDEEE